MADPLIVLLIVTLADAKDATASAMTVAARRALGPQAIVLVDERAELPTDADALALAANVRARGVVEVAWAKGERQSARLHLHVEDTTEWVDREIRFVPEDSPQERGRTVGLALATMISERAQKPELPPPPPPAPRAQERVPSPPPEAPRFRRWAIEASGQGAIGLGGEADGGGGALAGRLYATEELSARMAAGARLGSLPAAEASFYELTASIGGGARLAATRSLEGGVRAEVLLTRFAVRRQDLERSRWLGGARFMLEADWLFAEDTYLLAAAGSELVFGPTDVDVGQSVRSRVPVARLAFEIGLRRRF